MIFYIIDFIIILLLLHQLVIPLFLGMPIFAFFRDKEKLKELSEVKQKAYMKKIDKEIKSIKEKMKEGE